VVVLQLIQALILPLLQLLELHVDRSLHRSELLEHHFSDQPPLHFIKHLLRIEFFELPYLVFALLNFLQASVVSRLQTNDLFLLAIQLLGQLLVLLEQGIVLLGRLAVAFSFS